MEVSSDSEEEVLVYAEFKNNVNVETYRDVHVLGITDKNPIIQTDETFFTGTYKNPLGTYMFFEDDPSPQSLDPLFDQLPEKNLKYLAKTNKLLCMEHAYVTPKEGLELIPKDDPKKTNDDVELVKFKTVQDALNKFQSELKGDLERPTTTTIPENSTESVQSPQTSN